MNSFSTEKFTFLDFIEMDEGMSRKVWECRNRPEIRKWMVNPEIITFEDHQRFICGLKDKASVRYYAVLQSGSLIGSVNIHIGHDGVAERGIYIHPDHWGKGLARKLCRDFYSYLCNNMHIYTITTRVLKDNVGSNSLERSLGAVKTSEDERFVYYICNLKNY